MKDAGSMPIYPTWPLWAAATLCGFFDDLLLFILEAFLISLRVMGILRYSARKYGSTRHTLCLTCALSLPVTHTLPRSRSHSWGLWRRGTWPSPSESEQAVGNKPGQCCKDNQERLSQGGGIFIYFLHFHSPTPPATCPVLLLKYILIPFTSSPAPCGVERVGGSKIPPFLSNPEKHLVLGILKKSLWGQKRKYIELLEG